jgi:ferredoxin
MTCTITNKCVSCEACLSQCPTGAIEQINGKFSINPNLCNDCVGFYGVPQCTAGCPTNGGCVPSLASLINSFKSTNSYWDNWFTTYNRVVETMKARQNSKYWQRWFDIYSQKLQIISH